MPELITSEEADMMQGYASRLFGFLQSHQIFESREMNYIMLEFLESFINTIDDFI